MRRGLTEEQWHRGSLLYDALRRWGQEPRFKHEGLRFAVLPPLEPVSVLRKQEREERLNVETFDNDWEASMWCCAMAMKEVDDGGK